MNSDEYYINQTFGLAKKAEGKTSPNPMVGCLIVKNGSIISSGFHRRAGLPHAEQEALMRARESVRGATLYVNLEPCCHWGRTPPCVDRIISAGIKRVVIAVKDPNPQVNGRSIRKLRRAGIQVKVGLQVTRAQELNEVFFGNINNLRPFVAAKVAQTLDGKIANSKGKSRWITSLSSRRFAKKLRARYDAILVGVNTVIKDNPRLNASKRLVKIILDPDLKTPGDANLFKRAKSVFIFTKKGIHSGKEALLGEKARIIKLACRRRGFDLRKILQILYSYQVTSVFVEGGSFTLGSFFDTKLVDKLYVFVSPKIMGKRNALDPIGGEGDISMSNITEVDDINIERTGRDFLFTGYPRFK